MTATEVAPSSLASETPYSPPAFLHDLTPNQLIFLHREDRDNHGYWPGGDFVIESHREYCRASSTNYCTAGAIVGIDIDAQMIVIPQTCKRWACDHCRPAKVKKWREIMVAGKPDRMLTLTIKNDGYITEEEALELLNKSWSKLIAFIRKTTGGECEYCRVIEAHKSGFPHIHALLRGAYISHRVIQKKWLELTGASIVDIRKVTHDDGAAGYLTKYLAKGFADLCERFPSKRLINRSRNWSPAEQPDKHQDDKYLGWIAVWDSSYSDVLQDIADSGGILIDKKSVGASAIYRVNTGEMDFSKMTYINQSELSAIMEGLSPSAIQAAAEAASRKREQAASLIKKLGRLRSSLVAPKGTFQSALVAPKGTFQSALAFFADNEELDPDEPPP